MVFIRSGNFIAYALIMSCDQSVEQSSPMIISYLKFVFWERTESKALERYGAWLYVKQHTLTFISFILFQPML